MAQKARVVISFEVPGDLQTDEAAFVEHTLRIQDQVGVSATWASPDVGQLQAILGPHRQSHELALAAPSQLGDRTEFAAWLLDRKSETEAQRMPARTIFADPRTIDGQLDLLVKHRISTLVARGSVSGQRGELERFGVVVAPAPIRLDGDFAWWAGGPRGAVRRSLHQAIQQGGLLHISANVRAVVKHGRSEGVWAAIQDAAHRQRYGLVQIAAFRELAQQHRVLRTGTGRSILRAA